MVSILNKKFVSELDVINQKIVSGVNYKQVLDYIFDSLQAYFPCDRISIALLSGEILTTHWLRSKFPISYINVGYSASIKGSSLANVIESGHPRIIEDLKKYSEEHPQSGSTNLALKEGILSSLTCPLISRGKAVGVIFFSSAQTNTYKVEHIEKIKELTNSLALVVEQGRLQKFYDESEYKSKMYSMITHDLRSPIGVMLGFLDIIYEEDWYSHLAPKEKEIFSVLKRNCDSMLGLVNDLSDDTRLSNNRMNFNFSDVDVKQFFAESVENAEIVALQKNIKIKVNIKPDIPDIVNFDPRRLRQVMDNLVSNAMKFSMPDTSVELNLRCEDENLLFSIIDEGPGIPENELPKLFKEYGKTSVRPTGRESSTGLGLAIVKKIVERHGGKVSVVSKLGKGSTFEVSIPVLR